MAARKISAIHDDLMRFKPEGMTPNAWAMKAGVSRTVWSDMRRHGNPSRRTLEKLLIAAGSSLAEFEALRIGGAAPSEPGKGWGLSDHRGPGWGPAQLPALPVLSTEPAGMWGKVGDGIEFSELRTDKRADRLPRPASLASHASAYAVTIAGNSMWPRFRPGRHVAVSPESPVAAGDDVLVKLKRNGPAKEGSVHILIKELVRQHADGVELRQFSPDVTFHVDAADILSIEKVIGELI